MVEQIKGAVATMQGIPRDCYAIVILAIGAFLVFHEKDAGMLVLGGALAVFKGDRPQ